jgi:hypothetical protein
MPDVLQPAGLPPTLSEGGERSAEGATSSSERGGPGAPRQIRLDVNGLEVI